MKRLSELVSCSVPEDIDIDGIEEDSRKVSGGIFISVLGNEGRGKDFCAQAIKNGAKVIVLPSDVAHIEVIDGILYLYVTDLKQETSNISSKFFDSKFDNIATVTGTNGKTSTVDMFRQIMNLQNIPTASIGTLGVIAPNYCEKSEKHLTSPGAIELHRILHDLTGKVRNVVMESSSHGIFQKRIANINFRVCAFTNLTEDHLDFHKTMEEYWNAKKKLFSEIAPQTAKFVVNADSEKEAKDIQDIAAKRRIECIAYGRNSDADVHIKEVQAHDTYQDVTFTFAGHEFSFRLNLVGDFQVYNAMCALCMCYACGADMQKCVDVMDKVQGIPGRMELAATYSGGRIFIDYAHTPDALKNALISLRKSTQGRIFVVFGCGGERDPLKRPIMGAVAQEYADVVVITDDNPRTEDPDAIRKEIMRACSGVEIADRAEAIRYAMDQLSEGDSLLIAGKGHEDYQIIGTKNIHFSDKEIVLEHI